MATAKHPTGFHSPTAKFGVSLGDFNSVTKVAADTITDFSGSRTPGAGFIVEVVSNVVIHCANGGTIPGSTLLADTLYPIGVSRVVNGNDGIVYVLHR